MSYGEGYELFTCPNCGGALYDPGLGCVECGYGSERSPSRSGVDTAKHPKYSGGDEVLKARLRDEDRARKERRDQLSSEGGIRLPTQEELIRVALAEGGGNKGEKRRKNKRPNSPRTIPSTRKQHSASAPSQNKLMARPSSADQLLRKLPIARGATFEEWLPSARQGVTVFAQQHGGTISSVEPNRQEQVDRLLYQLYCQLRRKQQSLQSQLRLAQAIVNAL